MAESVKASEDPKVAADIISSEAYQRFKISQGADGTATDVSSAAPLFVKDALGIEKLEALATLLGGTIKVSDGSGSITIDAPLATPVGVRLSDGTSAIGSTAQRLHVDDGGSTLSVDDGGGKLSVDDGGGSITIDGEIETPQLLEWLENIFYRLGESILVSVTGTVDPRGNVAHDAADSGNPVKVGARALTSLIAAVSNNDRVDLTTDKFARLLSTVAPLDQLVSGSTNFVNATAADVIPAPGASTALVITGLKVVNGHATVGTKVEILNDATKIDIGYAGPLGGGWVTPSNSNGLFPPLTTNKALRAKCLTTGADVDVTAYGYKVPA